MLLALLTTRALTRMAVPLQRQRILTIMLAIASTLLLLRLYVYLDYRLTDLSWLGRFVWEMGNLLQRIPPSFILSLGSLYLWWRGIELAQRDLGVVSIGFSFRLGIVAFLWLFLVRVFGSPVDAIPYAFVYFLVGLIILGLARIQDVSESRIGIRSPFDASWVIILVISTALVLGASVLAGRIVSLRNVGALLNPLRPVIGLLTRIAAPLLLIAAWLLEHILTTLIGLFRAALGDQEELLPLSRFAEEIEQWQQLQRAQNQQSILLLVLRLLGWAFLVLLFLAILAAIAFSISDYWSERQRQRAAEHDSVWDRETAAKDTRKALQNRWLRWRQELASRLAWLRGEEYALTSIRQIYSSLVKLATSEGMPRQEAETPYEYVARLKQAFPGSDQELALITDAYVSVHYGERSFRSEYVQRVREAWLAIRVRQNDAAKTRGSRISRNDTTGEASG